TLVVNPAVCLRRLAAIRRACGDSVDVRFALKSAATPAIADALKKSGVHLDVASHEELDLALALGYSPKRLHFYGPGATAAMLRDLCRSDINITLDSPLQADVFRRFARRRARVSLRVMADVRLRESRVGVDSTGRTKLGMPAAVALEIALRLREAG